MAQFFFAIHKDFDRCDRNDFECVYKNKHGNELTKYALSALAICVNFDDTLKSCTTRCNHDLGLGDHELNINEIEEILGVDFKKSFKVSEKLIKRLKKFQKVVEDLKNIISLDELEEYCEGNDYVHYNYSDDSYYIVELENGKSLIYELNDDEVEYRDCTNTKFFEFFDDGYIYENDGLVKLYHNNKVKNLIPYNEGFGIKVLYHSYISIYNGRNLIYIYNTINGKSLSFKSSDAINYDDYNIDYFTLVSRKGYEELNGEPSLDLYDFDKMTKVKSNFIGHASNLVKIGDTIIEMCSYFSCMPEGYILNSSFDRIESCIILSTFALYTSNGGIKINSNKKFNTDFIRVGRLYYQEWADNEIILEHKDGTYTIMWKNDDVDNEIFAIDNVTDILSYKREECSVTDTTLVCDTLENKQYDLFELSSCENIKDRIVKNFKYEGHTSILNSISMYSRERLDKRLKN